jgi:hypothetical protein
VDDDDYTSKLFTPAQFVDHAGMGCQRPLVGTASSCRKSKICGLSANDIEKSFLESGADMPEAAAVPEGGALS